MADVGDGHLAHRSPDVRWSWHPWRFVPPLLVLITVLLIWLTRFGLLITNHWAYPLTLVIVGVIAALLAYRARPRRRRRPLPYPPSPDSAPAAPSLP